MNTYYKLITEFYNTGKITAKIETVEISGEKPKAKCEELDSKDVYIEYFGTHKEAVKSLDESGEDYLML